MTLIILHLEDDPDDAAIVEQRLRRANPGLTYGHAQTLEEAEAMLAESDRPDLLLLDWQLTDTTGFEAVDALEEKAPGVPIIVLTGHVTETLRTSLRLHDIRVIHKNSLTKLLQLVARHENAEGPKRDTALFRTASRGRQAAVAGGIGIAGAVLAEAVRILIEGIGG